MKGKDDVKRSARARLNQVIRESERLNQLAGGLKTQFSKKSMAELRRLAESVVQCVHEYSAYSNVLLENEPKP